MTLLPLKANGRGNDVLYLVCGLFLLSNNRFLHATMIYVKVNWQRMSWHSRKAWDTINASSNKDFSWYSGFNITERNTGEIRSCDLGQEVQIWVAPFWHFNIISLCGFFFAAQRSLCMAIKGVCGFCPKAVSGVSVSLVTINTPTLKLAFGNKAPMCYPRTNVCDSVKTQSDMESLNQSVLFGWCFVFDLIYQGATHHLVKSGDMSTVLLRIWVLST